MSRITLAAVLLIASLALAESPATQPAANDYPALRKRLAQLERELKEAQDELAKVKAENAQLSAKIDAKNKIEAEAAAAETAKDPDVGSSLKVGMDWEEAKTKFPHDSRVEAAVQNAKHNVYRLIVKRHTYATGWRDTTWGHISVDNKTGKIVQIAKD